MTTGTLPRWPFALGDHSLEILLDVHDDLSRVVKRAITMSMLQFVVVEGMRSEETHRELFSVGGTPSMNSRHLTGHAVALLPFMGHEIRYDWPLFDKIANAMKLAALEEDVTIEWAGDQLMFRNGPEFFLPWDKYPL